MLQALALLTAALQLLIAANNPSIPDSVKQQAVSVANFAIRVANQSLASSTVATVVASVPTPPPAPVPAPSPTPVPPSPQYQPVPVFGAITPSPAPTPIFVPVPVPVPAPFLPVMKELVITGGECGLHPTLGTTCGVGVAYKEDGEKKAAIITVSSDDGKFMACNCNPLGESLTAEYLEGNPLTARTYRIGNEWKQSLVLSYYPTSAGAEQFNPAFDSKGNVLETAWRITRTITATANGMTTSKTFTSRYYYMPK